ncbi:MAG: aspartate dehydrogenase [Alphaproteobacteria bacterium]|nr:aspartate dehydrogenase [Alphaproteobacteria bacterium]MCB9931624.1 aspartate dehydrogenase [Alphaproteobacteria bacterium]
MTVRIGVIGHGAIGRELATAIRDGRAGDAHLAGVLVQTPREPPPGLPLTADATAFFAAPMDAVIECAGHGAVRAHGEAALRAGADLYVTAVGALADAALRARLETAARAAGRRLVIPSAGIGALDILAGAAVGGLDRVRITVRKDVESWRGTPAEALCDLGALAEPFEAFRGPVADGAPLYPGNVNISMATALAGIGPERTELVIVADPTIATHVVRIEAEGAFGRFAFEEDVLPSDANRKTGRIVAMALIKTVRQLSSPLIVGA